MYQSNVLRGFSVAAFAATVLFAVQPAAADIIEINNFWSKASYNSNVTIDFHGIDWRNGNTVNFAKPETAGAGGFKTYDLTTDPQKKNAFQSFCVDIFDSFSFAVDSKDTKQSASVIISRAAADLGRLYSNHHAAIDSTNSSAENEAAFQLAVWEIVNERGTGAYTLTAGAFTATGTGFSLAQQWLRELGMPSASSYVASIWRVQSMLSKPDFKGEYPQDLVVFAPVPEPQTYAMILVGLGLLGFSARRKDRHLD